MAGVQWAVAGVGGLCAYTCAVAAAKPSAVGLIWQRPTPHAATAAAEPAASWRAVLSGGAPSSTTPPNDAGIGGGRSGVSATFAASYEANQTPCGTTSRARVASSPCERSGGSVCEWPTAVSSFTMELVVANPRPPAAAARPPAG
eukprot:scaffold5122_cov120-Isochrysis_galbana.AAC.3